MRLRPEESVATGRLDGLGVLIVEDEPIIAMNLESMLEELGCRVLATMMRLAPAEAMLSSGFTADAAVLDVDIAGSPVFPLAEKLKARDIPIVFATGYGRLGVPPIWQNCPILKKPYTINGLSQSLNAAVKGDGTCPR